MKNCEEIAALLDAWIDGALPEPEMAEVRSHLAACGDCQAYVDAALAIRAAFPSVEETEVPPGFADGIMAAIRLESRKHKKMPWGKIVLPMAACLALIVAVQHFPISGNKAPPAAPPAAGQMMVGTSGFAANDAVPEDAQAGVAPQIAPSSVPPPVPPAAASNGETSPVEESASPKTDVRSVPPPEYDPMVTLSAAPTLTLTAAQAGTLLDEFTGCAYESGTVSGALYELNGDEYAALLAALPDSIPQPPAPETPLIQVLVTF